MNQQKLPFPPVLMREPKEADMLLVRMCKTAIDALKLQIQLSGYSHEFVASQLEIDKGHMSRIMSGAAHFPANKYTALNWLTGNLAFLQFLAWEAKRGLIQYVKTPEEEIAELKAKVSLLEARRA